MNADLLNDGIILLSSLEIPTYPLVYYYQAWFYAEMGNASKAAEMLRLAENTSLDNRPDEAIIYTDHKWAGLSYHLIYLGS